MCRATSRRPRLSSAVRQRRGIPEKGEIDLQAFHIEEGRKCLIAYAVLAWVTVATNAVLGHANGIVIVPMAIATVVAAIFIKKSWVQSLALAIQIGGWIWYFVALQTALSG